jgi:uroporphyrinogen-III synthase
VQEYGRPAAELEEGLRARGAEVMPVRVYEWDLPEDRGPLEEAARRLAAREFDTVLFTTSFQLVHLMRVAKELGIEDDVLRGLRAVRIASIGPTTSETLHEYGLEPSVEASHPKLGFLVREAAEAS